MSTFAELSLSPASGPDGDALARVDACLDRGQFLTAWEIARGFGPLASWRGDAARRASSLAANLGAPGLALRIDASALRAAPKDAAALAEYVSEVLQYRGPLAAWLRLADASPSMDASPKAHADLLLVRSLVAACLRDFGRARALLADAEALAPEHRRLANYRAAVLEREDRYEEALAAAQDALAANPLARSSVQQAAGYLVLLGRHAEARALLERAARNLESGLVQLQLAALQIEMHDPDAAAATVERYPAMSPLLERRAEDVYCALRSRIAYMLGDIESSIAFARKNSSPVLHALADRMERAPSGTRSLELRVPFVRQHRMTCVPATLTAISRHWGMPADHLTIAEAICYDGTPAHSERAWAETNGWRAGEFTVTWEAARSLLDRGVPFVVTTAFAAEGHAQAIVGYDERRGTFSVRDPTQPGLGEIDVEKFLLRFRSTGPRGMWLVPEIESTRVEGLSLPDAELWDRLYAVQRALSEHRGDSARAACDVLRESAPEHPITFAARRAVAGYDGNVGEVRAVAEDLLAHSPDDARAELDVLTCMRADSPRPQRIAWLEATCSRKVDPIFLEALGEELHEDAREHARAQALLRRAMGARPHRARPLTLLANIAWQERRSEEALELYRFAACLEDLNEGYGRAYFVASRLLGKTEEALSMLRDRVAVLGKRSSAPEQTLHWALDLLERGDEGRAVLDEALARRPDDGPLLLYAAGVEARRGGTARAEALLAQARSHARETEWLRVATEVAHLRGDDGDRTALLKRMIEIEPLAVGAHAALADAIAENEGVPAATRYLEATVSRFPHHRGLLHLLATWNARLGGEARANTARRALAVDPNDSWAERELALALAESGQFEEALQHCARAERIQPNDVRLHLVRGQVLSRAGRTEAAHAAWREAFLASVDNEQATRELLVAAPNAATRAADLEFVERELRARSVDGLGVLTWYAHVRADLPGGKALDKVAAMRGARPDLWPAWVAHVRELVANDQLDQARALAAEATRRFALVAEVWIELVDVEAATGQADTESVERAVTVAPVDSEAIGRLAAILERQGDVARARSLLERAVRASPTRTDLGLQLASVLWRSGDPGLALERLRRLVALDPNSERAWSELQRCCTELGHADEAIERARAAARVRPSSARMACILAMVAAGASRVPEALEALDRATAIESTVGRCPRPASDLARPATTLRRGARRLPARGLRSDAAARAARPRGVGEEPAWRSRRGGRGHP